ncbi:MAG: glycosyltransferase family 4 protein, partial [Desulfuromonas sp.]
MRVLFLNYEFPPIGGGGANANAYLFRAFAKSPKLQIDCVTSTMAARDEQVKLADNITLYRLVVGKEQLHYWTQREVLTWLWRADHFVAKLLKQRRYDLCHAFFGFPAGAVAWRRRDDFPYLVSLRGSDVPGFNPRFGLQYLLLKPLFRRIWRGAKSVVANSDGLKLLANRFMPELPISVIPNGIDTTEFTP